MKEKISMVKLTEKQAQSVRGGVVWRPCWKYDSSDEPYVPCGCYIGSGRCAYQLWPDYNEGCFLP